MTKLFMSTPTEETLTQDDKSGMTEISSQFLLLPRELRDQIYLNLFQSTRVTFGQRIVDKDFKSDKPKVKVNIKKPAAHALAILRTCQQVHAEAKGAWLTNILFDFEDSETLVDKLSCLSNTTLSQIRYMRLQDPTHYASLGWDICDALRLFPNLQLNTLAVLGHPRGHFGFDDSGAILDFIKFGHGWKELQYTTWDIMAGDRTLAPMNPFDGNLLDLTGYEDQITLRDGAESGASVQVFRPSLPEHWHVHQIGAKATCPGVLVVVKRGRNADLSHLPDCDRDIRDVMRGKNWEEIRRIFSGDLLYGLPRITWSGARNYVAPYNVSSKCLFDTELQEDRYDKPGDYEGRSCTCNNHWLKGVDS